MRIQTILANKSSDVVTILPDVSISAAAAVMRDHRIGAVVVADGPELLGILSERDIVRGLAAHGNGCLDMQASELMSHPVVTCTPEDSIDGAMATMTEKRFRHLPVMANGRMQGIVSIGDIVKSKIEHIEQEAAEMRNYIASA